MMTFETSGLKPEILSALADLGFVTPTPIQQQTISLIMNNSEQDLIALAQTGTGKTAAFSLPLLQNLTGKEKEIRVLILAPTRELCLQIANDIKAYTKYLPGIKSVAVYGGANIKTQIDALRDGAQIVIGTPGRTLDLIERKKLKIENISTLVLDEADEMLSMGFKDELDAILNGTPADKQVLLFSATMPDEIRKIASKYMKNPKEVSSGRENKSNENISHYYYLVNAKDRYNALKRIADVNPDIYAIIFCRTKAETQEIADKMGHDGYNADALHGDLSQPQRDYVMNRFRKRQLQILVATDVAARGLDVTELTHVINFNLPDDPEVYIHRSGRTGRAGNLGQSVSVVHSKEMFKIKQLERKIGKPIDHALVPTGKEICETQLLNLIDKVKEVEIDESRIKPFIPAIMERIADIDHTDLIKKFVLVEFNRFLDYYKDAVDINMMDKGGRREKSGEDSKFTRFFMNHGTQSKISPGVLIDLINEHIPNKNVNIGKIDIKKTISLFDVETEDKELVISSFKKTSYKGLIVRPDVEGDGGSGSDRPERSRSYGGGRSESGDRSRSGGDRGRSGGGYGSGRSEGRGDRAPRRRG
jgi:ATP-dependent RNA helicase DeaD